MLVQLPAGCCSAHLLVGYRDEPVLGQLPHDVQVRPHVQLAADQHHLGVGTELLGLTLPLRVTRRGTVKLHTGIVNWRSATTK